MAYIARLLFPNGVFFLPIQIFFLPTLDSYSASPLLNSWAQKWLQLCRVAEVWLRLLQDAVCESYAVYTLLYVQYIYKV